MSDENGAGFVQGLRSHIGERGQPQVARDPVNQPMIRHWCDAMEDHNPVYTDPDRAAKSVHGQIVAPPTMLMAWTMLGNIPRLSDPSDPQSIVLAELDAAGYTSVVATNTEHEYPRYLRLGEQLFGVLELADVSEEKHTGLGVGHFVTSVTEYRNGDGEVVGRLGFRVLKFKPGTGRKAPAEGEVPKGPRPVRPRPGVSRDTRFFWDGVEAGELRIQRCSGCGHQAHPPVVRCPACGSYDLGYTAASGRGTIYSFVEPCYPQVPAFDYPYVVGLIELEEGTRILSNVVDIDVNAVHVGMPVELVFRKPDPGLTLPMFRPRAPERRETTLRFDEVSVGQALAPHPIDVTAKLVVAGAIASRDFQDVHHDRDRAIAAGSPDIFMNILTTGGLVGRYASDWAGPEARIRSMKIRLGAPNYPGDVMTLSGSVLKKTQQSGGGRVELALRGYNRLGDHVTGTVEVDLPSGGANR